jgi:hypothetical protein
MRKWIIGALLLGAFQVAVFAQDEEDFPQGQGGERMQALKVGFITERLKLTPDESQKFWPIFNEYEAEQKKIRQKHKLKQDFATMTDSEAEQLLSSGLEMEQQLLNLKKDYLQRMRKVIPVRKVAMLNRAERDFKEELLKRLRELQQNRQQRKLNRN